MGQQCLTKSRDMVATIVIAAHDRSQKLFAYYAKKKEYSYKSAPMNEREYENDILLEEDDENGFDYEESHIPQLLTAEDLKKLKEPTQIKQKDQSVGLLDIPQTKQEIKQNDDIDQVVNEIENNLYNEENTTGENGSKKQDYSEEDHNEFMAELDNMIKFDEDEELLDSV